jgi:transposase
MVQHILALQGFLFKQTALILRTGCQWRYLSRDFPLKSTVWRYFDQWRRDGTLGAASHPLDRGADVRLARPLSAAEQGPRKDR